MASGYDQPTTEAWIRRHRFIQRHIVDGMPLIEALGLVNPGSRPLPHPGTLVVAPDGTIIHAAIFQQFRQRERIDAILAAIDAHRASGAVAEATPPMPPSLTPSGALGEPELGWTVPVARPGEPVALTLTLQIPQGLHLYGPEEDQARPSALSWSGLPAGARVEVRWPEAREKELNGERYSIYESEVAVQTQLMLPADTAAGSHELAWELGYQVCSEDSCSFPRSRSGVVEVVVE